MEEACREEEEEEGKEKFYECQLTDGYVWICVESVVIVNERRLSHLCAQTLFGLKSERKETPSGCFDTAADRGGPGEATKN